MKIKKLKLRTQNITSVVQFYNKLLELPIVEILPEKVSFLVGESVLEFIEDIESTLRNPICHIAFNIPCNLLKEAVAWSETRVDLIENERGILVSDFESWHANSVYFYDYEGNLLEFIARQDLNNEALVAFNSKCLLNISEIGIVKMDPRQYADDLSRKYGLPLFSKNNNNGVFTAIGNDEGLLIVVKEGRCWFPTSIPAQNAWTQVTVLSKDDLFVIET